MTQIHTDFFNQELKELKNYCRRKRRMAQKKKENKGGIIDQELIELENCYRRKRRMAQRKEFSNSW